jgi:hypothetical protein
VFVGYSGEDIVLRQNALRTFRTRLHYICGLSYNVTMTGAYQV